MEQLILTQMHIEAARNSTDDFNLFHDKHRWQRLQPNPFDGPIALGFQLACFIEDQVRLARETDAAVAQQANALPYACYELTFAGAVRPGDELSIVVRSAKVKSEEEEHSVSNRLAMKANGKTVMLGYKREKDRPLFELPDNLPEKEDYETADDRSFVGATGFFKKRKFMIVGNAKNFLTSAFVEQSDYIDEFVDKVSFPETYPLSLISSALLERAQASGVDLVKDPMIYTSHRLCIDKRVLKKLSSNDALTILVAEPQNEPDQEWVNYRCIGLLEEGVPLFHCELQLAPLSTLQ